MKNQWCQIAVVAMTGVFPGAGNIRQFGRNIIEKKNAVIPVPADRWVIPPESAVSGTIQPDHARSDRAGLITDFQFDPHGFQVSKALLSGLDPVLALSLHAGRELLEGVVVSKDLLQRTGIILAAISLPTDRTSQLAWELLCTRKPPSRSRADALGACVVSMPAALTARALGLGGGAFTLDAACASSLVAVKLACEQLAMKRTDMMIAGGVSRPDSLYTQIGFTQLNALSPSGICAPFDRDADGLVVGEGVGMLALKRLDDAVAGGDRILAVITGAGVSNDIEGNLVAPASEGQIRAMTAAYKQAGWSITDLQYVECHGSGTPVGDQVELTSLENLLLQSGGRDKKLAIGSIKSMTGHLLTAAGAAGFIKTLMALNGCYLPPSLHFNTPSEKSPLNRTGMVVQTTVDDWVPESSGQTRKAGISAFGFGGINAHILIEEFRPGRRTVYPGTVRTSAVPEAVPCAIVGMAVLSPAAPDLDTFAGRVFNHEAPVPAMPEDRFRTALTGKVSPRPGLYLKQVTTFPAEFHIPPNQIQDILPQHILMLKTAAAALADARIPPRPSGDDPARTKMGAAVGIEFDHEATDFYLRWKRFDQDARLKDGIAPPLTFNRTLGALGGIVASRLAREFKLGGPCFTVSGQAASGLKALDIGITSLSRGETDLFICGCVDMAQDVRQAVLDEAAGSPDSPLPGDGHFGILPSEGSAALILKRLDDALAGGDRIYAVITQTSARSAGELIHEDRQELVQLTRHYQAGLESLPADTHTRLTDIGLFETCLLRNDGSFDEPALIRSLLSRQTLLDHHTGPCCDISSAACAVGNTHAASAVFSLVLAGLALYRRQKPLISGTTVSWDHPGSGLKRQAIVSSISLDGACGHVLLEEGPQSGLSSKLAVPAAPAAGNDLIYLKPGRWPIPPDIFERLNPEQPAASPDRAFDPVDPRRITDIARMTANAHETFLELSRINTAAMGEQLGVLTLMSGMSPAADNDAFPDPPESGPVLFDRDQCLEFATRKAGRVLGPSFDVIDQYPVRVRLPDEPLMLVDRILHIEGEMGSLGKGKIVTQHDVLENAWYLDGNRAPVSISIEAGQADLFLCSYLGIDHRVMGKRKYRLLDAKVTFHRSLARPGEIIEYHIEIDRFLQQGDVYLFFFHYRGYIDRELYISMRDGCAGFFTDQEVTRSGGIILTTENRAIQLKSTDVAFPVPVKKESFSDDQVSALRRGDLEAAFGRTFKNKFLSLSLALPGGRMHLIDRVLELDPHGGRFGLGFISAEADITPDKWFLTCHFIDDRVMPGTLMYECCAHALRIFTQRIGWVSSLDSAFYDVMINNESDLKCRGPVTPSTRKARYDIEIKEMGYDPEPYVIADAHMFSDDLRIVCYKNMGLKLMGVTRRDIENDWRDT